MSPKRARQTGARRPLAPSARAGTPARAHQAPRRWVGWLAVALALLITGGVVFARRAGRGPAPVPLTQAQLKNQLAGAASPYLRSAAEQPVAWQEWGPEAFRLARMLDRPIWLDIGAIWCHWCHVMDRESYGNPEIAALINANFVPMKVDRDERPDIDTRYQLAHQVINGSGGGWPLTMFLKPDGEPFAGGTYFPPDARERMPGIRQLVPAIAGAYHQQPDRVVSIGKQVRQTLANFRSNTGAAGTLRPALPLGIARRAAGAFDSVYGGFGREPGPKFPEDIAIRLALAEGFLTRDRGLQRVALRTLDAYARSGMRDYVNGGFFRYSTNRELTVPHFEKMDYVQSGLLAAYLDAYRLTGDARYALVARDIMRYVNATLSDRARGGFYAHQDADTSLDDDGSYYTWSLAQLKASVPPPEADALRAYYHIEERGEMASHPAQNVLRVARSTPEAARPLGVSETEAARRVRDGTARLAATRARHQPPLVEHTKFTDRNAMMVAAYLDAYETLGDTAARQFALRTLDFLLNHAVSSDGSVRHATADERSYVDGMMGDYAGFADALLDAFQVSGDGRYLHAAERIMTRAAALFWDEQAGGWRGLADRTLSAFAGAAAARGSFAATYALAAEALLRKPPQAVIIGPRADRRTGELAMAAWRAYRPGRLVATYDPTAVALDSLPEAVAGAARVFKGDATPRAYVCVGETCAPPTTLPTQVAALVRDYRRAGP